MSQRIRIEISNQLMKWPLVQILWTPCLQAWGLSRERTNMTADWIPKAVVTYVDIAYEARVSC